MEHHFQELTLTKCGILIVQGGGDTYSCPLVGAMHALVPVVSKVNN